jgi:hypothetical protein
MTASRLGQVGDARQLRHRILERGQNPTAQATHPAIQCGLALQAAFTFGGQELYPDTGINVSPGQHLIQGTLPSGVEIWVQAHLGEGSLPRLHVKDLVPGVEPGSQLPGTMDDLSQPPQ